MTDVIPTEKILFPSFNLNNGMGKTLKERFDEMGESRNQICEDILKDYYAYEQKEVDDFCKEHNTEVSRWQIK